MLNFGVRWAAGVRRPPPPPPSERLMKVRMGQKNYSFECCGVNELGTVPLHFDRKKRTNGGAKHTLQIHLPRKILYIISSPEICQINSMNRTSKIGTISKNLNVYFQIFLAIKIYIWMLLSRKCPLEGINWSFYNISLYD